MLSFYCALQEALIFDNRLVYTNWKEMKWNERGDCRRE